MNMKSKVFYMVSESTKFFFQFFVRDDLRQGHDCTRVADERNVPNPQRCTSTFRLITFPSLKTYLVIFHFIHIM